MITLLALAQRWPLATWRSRLARAEHQAAKLDALAAGSAGRLSVIRTAGDLETFLAARAQDPARVAGLLGIEGAQALDGTLAGVDRLFAAGVRMIGLAHFFDNPVAGSSAGVDKDGLTPLGREVVTRMQALGIAIDLAHVSPASVADALALATKPVVVSHTGVAATCAGPRNLTDEQIRGIAATGGVIGIAYFEAAVCGTERRPHRERDEPREGPRRRRARRARLRLRRRRGDRLRHHRARFASWTGCWRTGGARTRSAGRWARTRCGCWRRRCRSPGLLVDVRRSPTARSNSPVPRALSEPSGS